MSDIKLFNLTSDGVHELKATSVALEKSLQTLIEQYLDQFLGIRFLASEYTTGPKHGGRIDTLGIDENGCPVIIEYKRTINENVINQGLFYLDWLLDHKAEFKLLVIDKLGVEIAESIAWSIPRLLCIAGDFTKYDEYAVQQMSRNIQLIRYRYYGDMLLFELAKAVKAEVADTISDTSMEKKKGGEKSVTDQLDIADLDIKNRFEAIKAFVFALGDDVQMNTLKFYIAFKRIKNFTCVQIQPKIITLYVKLDPETVTLEEGFTQNVNDKGHQGTGNLKIVIKSDDDLRKAEPLLAKAYEIN